MVITQRFSLQTKGNTEVVDITEKVNRAVLESGARAGTATVFVTGSTAGVTTVEYEPGLVADLKRMFDQVVPSDIPYNHDARWGDGNGYSHVRASLLGPSLAVPFNEGKLLLGTWQQIVLIDFDVRPRSRQIVVQVAGE